MSVHKSAQPPHNNRPGIICGTCGAGLDDEVALENHIRLMDNGGV